MRYWKIVAAATIAGGLIGAAIALVAERRLRLVNLLPPESIEFQAVLPSILLWVAFSLYWTWASRVSAEAARSESRGSTALHQIVLNLAMLVSIVPPIRGVTIPVLPHCQIAVACGATLQFASILLAVWARRHLGANWSAEVRIAESHRLVQTGPYRYLRHPIYTAMLGMFLGTAIATGELHSLVALAVMVLAYVRKMRLEEQMLGETFGADFTRWKGRTKLILPFLWHS